MKISHQTKIKNFFKYFFAVTSTILSFFVLFLACGHPPAKNVKIIISDLQSSDKNSLIPVHISIRFDGYGGTLYKQKLLPGENEILLPKGPLKVSSGFLGIKKNLENELGLMHSSVYQEVDINHNTRTMEVYYSVPRTVQFRKFGLIVKKQTKTGMKPLSAQAFTIQDPISEMMIRHPKDSKNFGFSTDSLGRASVDLPILGQKNEYIELFISNDEKNNGNIIKIPLTETRDGVEFYEILIGSDITVNLLNNSISHYSSDTQTIQNILDAGKNPRFKDVISSHEFKKQLLIDMKKNSKIDLLSPLMQRNTTLGREITIQCKQHKSAIYENCPQFIDKVQLKNLLNIKTADKTDFLFLDQDGYSIFSDKESTHDNPKVITLQVPNN